jgi:hypothetical protein
MEDGLRNIWAFPFTCLVGLIFILFIAITWQNVSSLQSILFTSTKAGGWYATESTCVVTFYLLFIFPFVGNVSTLQQKFSFIDGIAADESTGTIYVAERCTVRQITLNGTHRKKQEGRDVTLIYVIYLCRR